MGRGGWAGRIVSGARAASPEFFFSKKNIFGAGTEGKIQHNMGLMVCRSGIAVKWKIKKYIHCSNIKTFLLSL